MAVNIPKRIGYAGGNLKDLEKVLKDLDAAITANLSLPGVTSTAAEINTLHSSGVTQADHIKLHAVTATAAEMNKLAGSGAVVASGTVAAHIADAKTDYVAGDVDTTAKTATVLNAIDTKLNAVIAALEAFGIAASS